MSVVILVLAVVTRWQVVGGAVGRLGAVGLGGIAALLAVSALQIAVRVRTLAVTVPGLSFRRALLVSEASVAASSWLLGGGMIGAGLKVSMLRSWAVAAPTIAVSLAATGVASSTATWGLGMAVSALAIAGDSGATVHVVVLAAGAATLVGTGGLWCVVLCHDGAMVRVARWGDWWLARLRRRWSRCPDGSAADWLGRGRWCGRVLVGAHGPHILALTVASQLLLGAVLIVAVEVVGVSGVSPFDAFSAFALVRVVAMLAPVPGGLGVTELGLVALLVEAGATAEPALAAVVAFRACTFLLHLLCGSVCVTGWRWSLRRSIAGAVVAAPAGPGADPPADGRQPGSGGVRPVASLHRRDPRPVVHATHRRRPPRQLPGCAASVGRHTARARRLPRHRRPPCLDGRGGARRHR